jgi:glycosyltransferase involved in cell wall biosynthesis
MKVLWFTNTPSKASKEFGYNSFGGGWISSLETMVVKENKHSLGICFFYDGDSYKKIEKNNVVYYGIPLQKENAFKRVLHRHRAVLNDEHSEFIDQVIADFVPDLIHVFGTEMGYGKLLPGKFKKVIFHLQGLTAPYSEVYFPPYFTKKMSFFSSSVNDMLRGLTFYNDYQLFKKRGMRELEILQSWRYFTGRTDWDRNYTRLINSGATYFHCEELLREVFFTAEWKTPEKDIKNKNIVIGTTINPNFYKGLDLIYKVIPLLKDYTIEWKLFGLTGEHDLNRVIKKYLGIKKSYPAIRFYGQTSSDDLIKELQTCHLFVHPSYIDNSPNSVCEAMLMGMPVLSSAVGGVSSLITHKETGFLFNPHDKYDLAGMIAHLATNYKEAVACGAKARIIALKRHNPEGISDSLNAIYNTVYND